jgi:hypothetical protein
MHAGDATPTFHVAVHDFYVGATTLYDACRIIRTEFAVNTPTLDGRIRHRENQKVASLASQIK